MWRSALIIGWVCLLCLWQAPLCNSYDGNLMMHNYPTAYTENNKVMAFLLTFNFYHLDPVLLILNEFVSICESGWRPTVVIQTTVEWTPEIMQYLRRKSFCYARNSSIEIRIDRHDPSVGIGLSATHRPYLYNEVNNYDLFVYLEDDIVFKSTSLAAFVHETKKLYELHQPHNILWTHTIGFQRFRRLNRDSEVGHYGEQDLFESELLEETPGFEPICMRDREPYLWVRGNLHSGMWIFTKQQVLMLHEKCSFMNTTIISR